MVSEAAAHAKTQSCGGCLCLVDSGNGQNGICWRNMYLQTLLVLHKNGDKPCPSITRMLVKISLLQIVKLFVWADQTWACQGGRPVFLCFLTHHSLRPEQPALFTLAIAYPCFSRLLQFWWSNCLDLRENYTTATGYLRMQIISGTYRLSEAQEIAASQKLLWNISCFLRTSPAFCSPSQTSAEFCSVVS